MCSQISTLPYLYTNLSSWLASSNKIRVSNLDGQPEVEYFQPHPSQQTQEYVVPYQQGEQRTCPKMLEP
jgi:hypothetical protein